MFKSFRYHLFLKRLLIIFVFVNSADIVYLLRISKINKIVLLSQQ